jgi:aspartate ammonia-lyase
MRKETDSLGSIHVEKDCKYGIHTQRAMNNFGLNHDVVHHEMVKAYAQVKKACSNANQQLGLLDKDKHEAILTACDEIIIGMHKEAFTLHPLQGGAGTSLNMNLNEVIANVGLKHLGHEYGEYDYLHPINDVNMSQSTNDTYPTAMRIASIKMLRELADEYAALQETFQEKEHEFANVLKLGRTQLMDALPMMAGQGFGAYASAISRDRWRIYKVEERLRVINLGGTAIGTGLNALQKYIFFVTEYIKEESGLGLSRSDYLMDVTQNMDVFVEVSGMLKAAASTLMKINQDFRLLSSGPNGGFGEMNLPKVQVGSSIMPGKVNPVIPEMVIQVCLKVFANDQMITQASSLGNLELNAFGPIIIDSLLSSFELMTNAIRIFREKAVEPLTFNEEKCIENLEKSHVLATALIHHLGYDQAAEIVSKCGLEDKTVKEYIIENDIMSVDEIEKILNPMQVVKPGIPGK